MPCLLLEALPDFLSAAVMIRRLDGSFLLAPQPRAGQALGPPGALTHVEGVGRRPVSELQIEEIGGLWVMAQPQGHTQDHASGQLGKERVQGYLPRAPQWPVWAEPH